MFHESSPESTESSHESVGSVLGRAMFQESSHENQMLGSGLGVVSRLGSRKSGMGGWEGKVFRTSVMKTMGLVVGNVWFHDWGPESPFDLGHFPWVHESSPESIDLI